MSDKNNLPTLAELTKDIDVARKTDELNLLLNQQPPEKWVKEHPYIKGYNYIPIDKIEMMLKRIFKRHRVEITGQGSSFNGVWVTVRVHFLHPVINEWDYHDGIGATELQTKKGATPGDMANINPGALAMAYPIAKTRAVKDACDHFGKLFGADLNRKDTLEYKLDADLQAQRELTEDEFSDLKRNIRQGNMSVSRATALFNLSDEQKKEIMKIENKNKDAA